MSRLMKTGHSITNERKRKFMDWRKGEPVMVQQPLRIAAVEAMRNEDKYAVVHLLAKKHKRIYSRCSKPQLLDLLAGVLRGERTVR